MKHPLNFPFSELDEIRSDIRKRLYDSDFFTDSKQDFCRNSIQHFNITEEERQKENWVEASLIKINENIYSDEIIRELGFKDDNLPEKDCFDLFIEYFWQYDILPGLELKRLKQLVESDLNIINGLIANYEESYPYLLTGDIRNHAQGTIKSFYDRCKSEKLKIEEHLQNGIKPRAESNSEKYGYLDSLIYSFMKERLDRPYDLPLFKEDYFDRDRINLFQHRLGFIKAKDAKGLGELYLTDKKEFYKRIEKDFYAGLLTQYIDWIPNFNNNRNEVFKELKSLYEEKRYWGFIALGITQIEGLFADLAILIKGRNHKVSGALPVKVDVIRDYYNGNIVELDYFQFHVPFFRNRFSHYGTISEFENGDTLELIAKDLLFDLIATLSIYDSVNADFKWLNNIIKNPEGNFLTCDGFVNYFRLYESVKKLGLMDVFEPEIRQLKETVLNDSIHDIFLVLYNEVEQSLIQLEEYLKQVTNDDGEEFVLQQWDRKRIATNVQSIQAIFSDVFDDSHASEVNKPLQQYEFISNYKKYIDEERLSPDVINMEERIRGAFYSKLDSFKFIADKNNFVLKL